MCLVAWPLNESEVRVDLVLRETFLLFLCSQCCYYANYIISRNLKKRSSEVSNQSKVIQKGCKMVYYFRDTNFKQKVRNKIMKVEFPSFKISKFFWGGSPPRAPSMLAPPALTSEPPSPKFKIHFAICVYFSENNYLGEVNER